MNTCSTSGRFDTIFFRPLSILSEYRIKNTEYSISKELITCMLAGRSTSYEVSNKRLFSFIYLPKNIEKKVHFGRCFIFDLNKKLNFMEILFHHFKVKKTCKPIAIYRSLYNLFMLS